jgi:hypothetical protein
MLLMTSNTRSAGVGQGRALFARRASERSPLTDDGAEGIRPRMLKGFVFSTFTHGNRRVYAARTSHSMIGRNCVIPHAFTHSNL